MYFGRIANGFDPRLGDRREALGNEGTLKEEDIVEMDETEAGDDDSVKPGVLMPVVDDLNFLSQGGYFMRIIWDDILGQYPGHHNLRRAQQWLL